jgi:flagellar L-ring protein precursor FlgH
MREVWEPPELSPVGADIHSPPLVEETKYTGAEAGVQNWIGGPADYFRDDRAKHVGDLVTVNIEIDDKANFSNTTDRSKKSDLSANAQFDMGILSLVGVGNGKLGAGSNSSMTGQGTIQRSEKLSIALSASVRQVLPNGLLVISGTQEVLVNSEKRVIRVAGIVDPKDITRANAISYDRIADARISYGGRGRTSDVQDPGWGQQVWDKLNPL